MSGASIETTLEPLASSLVDVKGPKQRVILTAWRPAKTSIDTLVKVEGHRWSIEDSFETAKNELGLDHNETRSWHGWHRHTALVMLAFAMTAAIRHHANLQTPPKTKAWRARMRLQQS